MIPNNNLKNPTTQIPTVGTKLANKPYIDELESTLFRLLTTDIPIPPIYSTGVNFIDKPLEGGIEVGQLVIVTGEPDAGKTMITEQIISSVAQGFPCLYFALEFNQRQIQKKFRKRYKNKIINDQSLKNITFISGEKTNGNMSHILEIIYYYVRERKTRFIVLDSTMMLYIDGMSGEQETTEIFRQIHSITIELDLIFFVITQSSKSENAEGKVGVFGSQKASHFANIMFHLTYDKEENIREFVLAKNKQNGKYEKSEIFFDVEKLIFTDT